MTDQVADTVRIAIVGDVHDHWDADHDEVALRHLGVDLVLLVGDFGNESVEVVRSIAALTLPKAVILGNHDAWYSASDWGRARCPYDRTQEDRVQQQLDLLGIAHVGYSYLDFPQFGLSIVGGRPFSWGGSEWKNGEFYATRYGVQNFQQSVERIVDMASRTAHETVIFVGHNGPYGLGDAPEDPCGKDWMPLGGDHGDPDLAEAIGRTRQLGKQIPLVTFGHMHHQLRHTKQVFRTAALASNGTVYLNAAHVPRILRDPKRHWRNFSLVELQAGQVTQATLVWLDDSLTIVSKHPLYQRSSSTQLTHERQ